MFGSESRFHFPTYFRHHILCSTVDLHALHTNIPRDLHDEPAQYFNSTMVEMKRFRRFYPLYNRYLALSIREFKEAEAIARNMIFCVNVMIMIQHGDGAENLQEEMELFQFLLRRFHAARNILLVEAPHLERRRRVRIPRTVASFSTIDIGNLFRFRDQSALRRLVAVWDFPLAANGKVQISNRGHYMHSEELFLSCIRRLSCKSTIDEICRVDMRNMETVNSAEGLSTLLHIRERSLPIN